jgi:transcriptional regulator with XRE-family HTH domain
LKPFLSWGTLTRMKALAENLKKYRLANRFTLKELAKVSNLKISTLSALEHDRIQNPSFHNLGKLAEALRIPQELLLEDENRAPLCHQGTVRGSAQVEFKKEGLLLVSYTPLLKELFIGKAILKPKSSLSLKQFPRLTFLFVEVIFGKLEVKLENKEIILTEGENLSLASPGKKEFLNPFQMKESSFLIVSTPSLISANLESQKPLA